MWLLFIVGLHSKVVVADFRSGTYLQNRDSCVILKDHLALSDTYKGYLSPVLKCEPKNAS